MEEELRLLATFTIAKNELNEMGTIVTRIVEVPTGTFARVSININGVEYQSEYEDVMIAMTQLRDQM